MRVDKAICVPSDQCFLLFRHPTYGIDTARTFDGKYDGESDEAVRCWIFLGPDSRLWCGRSSLEARRSLCSINQAMVDHEAAHTALDGGMAVLDVAPANCSVSGDRVLEHLHRASKHVV